LDDLIFDAYLKCWATIKTSANADEDFGSKLSRLQRDTWNKDEGLTLHGAFLSPAKAGSDDLIFDAYPALKCWATIKTSANADEKRL